MSPGPQARGRRWPPGRRRSRDGLSRPVDVVEVKEHRELVEDERRARSESGSQKGDPELARLEREGQAASDQAQHDPGYEMVNVYVADNRTPPPSDPRHTGVEASARQRQREGQEH